MGKPIIGITGYHVMGEEGFGGKFRGVWGQGFSVIGHDYIDAVRRAGGLPVGIPVGDSADCRQVVQSLDGLVLSGGEDIDPTLYGSRPDERTWTLTPERDRFELRLLEEALREDLPILAICRGMQLVNVYFGGTLYADVADHSSGALTHAFSRAPRWYLSHRVKLLAPSLRELYRAAEIEVNSYHHQAVDALGQGLEVTALAEDGIVEGLRHPAHPNLLAIQWHPEMMAVRYEEGLIPFRWLIRQAGGDKGKKTRNDAQHPAAG